MSATVDRAMIKSILVAVLVLAGCSRGDALIETPRPAPPQSVHVRSVAGDADWAADLSLDEAGKLVTLNVTCNGAAYAEASGGDDFPRRVVGAQIDVYHNTTCNRGQLEITVFALGDASAQGIPGRYTPVVFYFADGAFVGRSDVRGAE